MPTIQSLASSTGMMGSFPERSQGSLGQVRAQPAPGENPPYRVRQVRCRAPSRPGQGKAGNVRFLGVHTLLQHQEGQRRLPTRAQDTAKADEKIESEMSRR